jgi:hypothetical protein
MSVPDHGLEAIRKSAESESAGEYRLKTRITGLPGVGDILSATDLVRAFTWLDFGTNSERVDAIIYTAPSVTAQTLVRTFNYTQIGGKYRLDSDEWSLV